MKNNKFKIGFIVVIAIIFLFFGWFIKQNTLTAVSCGSKKVSIIMHKNRYYTYNFPFNFVAFCGEVIVENHKLLYISKYKNGSLNKERKVFYENGQLKLLALFKNGMLNGKLVGFYENSQKAIETFYKNDLENGQRTEWYENGSPKSIGFYKEGKKDGVFETWHNKGEISKKDWKQYATPKVISVYKNNIEQGPQVIFDINGTIISKKEFKKGKKNEQ